MSRTTDLKKVCKLGLVIVCELNKQESTQCWLAEEIGISYVSMWNIIQGRSKPKVSTLVKIAKCLDIDINKLLKVY